MPTLPRRRKPGAIKAPRFARFSRVRKSDAAASRPRRGIYLLPN
jgi:CDP-diacylglycerol--serine O-phosphatidyltransferase